MSLWRRVYQERRSVVLPLVVFLLANVGVYVLGVLPLGRSVESDRTAAFDALAGLGAARLVDTTAKNARARKEQADLELKKFYGDVLPTGASGAVNIVSFWLQQTAEAAGLQFKSNQTSQEPVKDSRLTRVASTVTLRGDYANVRRFLYAAETAPQFVVIEKVRLAEPANSDSATGGGLELVLDVSTYYVTPGGSGAASQ
jgi:Type II secretion system (T2SS), protein M subtype b